MGLYLSYIVSTKRVDPVTEGFTKAISGRTGHVSLAITSYDPSNPNQDMPVTLFRIGLFESGRVLLEDNIIRAGDYYRTFAHQSFPVSQEELSILLKAVNDSRRDAEKLIAREDHGQILEEEKLPLDEKVDERLIMDANVSMQSRTPDSKPDVYGHSLLGFNCKTYALTIMKRAGIDTSSLSNLFIDMPTFSGELRPITWKEAWGENRGKLIWNTPMHISMRSNLDSFTEEEKEVLKWEKAISDSLLKVDSYLAHIIEQAIKEVQSSSDTDLQNAYKRDGNEFVLKLLSGEGYILFSDNMRSLSKKFRHFRHINQILHGIDEAEIKEEIEFKAHKISPAESIEICKRRLSNVVDYLSSYEVTQDIKEHRGFFSRLSRRIGIKTSAEKTSGFIKKLKSKAESPAESKNITSSFKKRK